MDQNKWYTKIVSHKSKQMYFIHKRNFGDYFSDGHGYVKCNTNNCSNDCGITLPLYDTYYCSQRGEEYEMS